MYLSGEEGKGYVLPVFRLVRRAHAVEVVPRDAHALLDLVGLALQEEGRER